MSKYLERARELRAIEEPHYNCAQAVLIPFAERQGMSADEAYRLAQAFGGGMRMGNVCGAVTGAFMALGILGLADDDTIAEIVARVREHHDGCIDCADLLRANAEAGNEKRPFCDSLVYETVQMVEERLARS